MTLTEIAVAIAEHRMLDIDPSEGAWWIEQMAALDKMYADRMESLPNRDMPHFADVYSLSDFIQACTNNSFIDDDGSAYFIASNQMTRCPAIPSIVAGKQVSDFPKAFTGVAWFNK